MAIVSIPGLWIPKPWAPAAAVPTFGSLAIAASGRKVAFVLKAPKTGSIRKIHFRTGAVTSATDTDVRVETVSTTNGDPSGSLWAANTNVTVLAAALTANTWITTGALTADASVTRGDVFAVVIAPSGSPNYNVSTLSPPNDTQGFPYYDQFIAAWSKATGTLVIGVEYSDGSFAFIPGVMPATAITAVTISTSTTPDEVALKFRFPSSVRVNGCWVWMTRPAGADLSVVLYDSDGTTVLSTATLDGDIALAANSRVQFLTFPSSITLTANTFYFLSFKPTTTTSLAIYTYDVNAAALFDEVEGGQDFHYREATDAVWSAAVTTKRPFMGLVLDGIDGGGIPGGSPIVGSAIVRAA